MLRFCRDLREYSLKHFVNITLEKIVFKLASSPGICLNRLEMSSEYRMNNIEYDNIEKTDDRFVFNYNSKWSFLRR